MNGNGSADALVGKFFVNLMPTRTSAFPQDNEILY